VRTVQSGDQVTLFAQEGTVEWFTVAKARRPPMATAAVDDRVSTLERELAEMRSQLEQLVGPSRSRPRRPAARPRRRKLRLRRTHC
jgi:hypothetical protein